MRFDMRKKESIIWLLFPIIWLFWLFCMPGYIGNMEGTNFFQHGMMYFDNFIDKPGGWSDYAEHFLLQFYQWRWLGALIQTLILVGIFLFTRGIIAKIGIGKNRMIFSSLPFLMTLALQTNLQPIEGQIVEIFFLYLLMWSYLQVKHSVIRYSIATILSPIVFLILGGVGTIALYLSISVYELFKNKGVTRIIFIVLWLLIVAAQPFVWYEYIYISNMEDMYMSLAIKKYIFGIVYGYMFILLCISWANKKFEITKNLLIVESLGILIIFGTILFCVPNYKIESFFKMDQAAIKADWDEVIELAEKLEHSSREEACLTNLALASKGELGDRLFEFNSQLGVAGLYLPRELEYKNSVLEGEFYYRMYIPNEAIHMSLQAAIDSPQGMDFRTLRRLIEINIQKGNTIVADKYLTILENATNYSNWCEDRRAELANPSIVNSLLPVERDFFIGSRPFISDMARVFDSGANIEMTQEYVLCYLLLNKDLNRFYSFFDTFYKPVGGRIPKIYQEALLYNMLFTKKTLKNNYNIDPEINKRFLEYNASMSVTSKSALGGNKQQIEESMKAFDDTLWYYLNFATLPKVSARGQIIMQ